MTQHLVQLWLESDEDPSQIEWEHYIPEGFQEDAHVVVKTFPANGVYHEITWWVLREMTLEEWSELDNAESDVLYKILGDNFMGSAGPIPFEKSEDA